ncbi:hypothetical protein UlMin_003555 [Ulmus minor]
MAESSSSSQRETIFEERKELMVSSINGGYPVLRNSHFLKPSVSHYGNEVSSLLTHNHPTITDPNKLPLKAHFRGWRNPLEKWVSWVDSLETLHQATWEKTGIYEAIMASKCRVRRDKALIFALGERWCSHTKTLVFPWGEATITLEDLRVLGGFSVLGEPVMMKLGDQESIFMERRLEEATYEAVTANANKATTNSWLEYFMGKGGMFEHQGFLSYWLTQFVFPQECYFVGRHVFPIAIRLAKGIELALAPAVLASIYRDLSLLNEELNAAKTEFGSNKVINLTAPFKFFQLWAWERFPALAPIHPIWLTNTSPRAARWDNLKKVPIDNLSLALDSAGESFKWRPYVSSVHNLLFPKFNLYREKRVLVDQHLEKELQTFALCLRVSELVGTNCIEQYLPHRVAKQFGFDQDIPCHVARCNGSAVDAWRNYSRKIGDMKLYLPSDHFVPGVTMQYLKWWQRSIKKEMEMRPCNKRKRDTRRLPGDNNQIHPFVLAAQAPSSNAGGAEMLNNNNQFHQFLPPTQEPSPNVGAVKMENNNNQVHPFLLAPQAPSSNVGGAEMVNNNNQLHQFLPPTQEPSSNVGAAKMENNNIQVHQFLPPTQDPSSSLYAAEMEGNNQAHQFLFPTQDPCWNLDYPELEDFTIQGQQDDDAVNVWACTSVETLSISQEQAIVPPQIAPPSPVIGLMAGNEQASPSSAHKGVAPQIELASLVVGPISQDQIMPSPKIEPAAPGNVVASTSVEALPSSSNAGGGLVPKLELALPVVDPLPTLSIPTSNAAGRVVPKIEQTQIDIIDLDPEPEHPGQTSSLAEQNGAAGNRKEIVPKREPVPPEIIDLDSESEENPCRSEEDGRGGGISSLEARLNRLEGVIAELRRREG